MRNLMAGNLSLNKLRDDIKAILRNADLSSLSSKKIRKQLEETYETDLTAWKKDIDNIVLSLLESNESNSQSVSKNNTAPSSSTGKAAYDSNSNSSKSNSGSKQVKQDVVSDEEGSDSEVETGQDRYGDVEDGQSSNDDGDASNGTNDMQSDSDIDKPEDFGSPRKKKAKRQPTTSVKAITKPSTEMNDEEIARRLQEEENRRTRPSTAKKTVATKKRSERFERFLKRDDSNGEKKKRGGKLFLLSPLLANLVGIDRMSRSDLVKRMWEIVKERNLADPKQRNFMICDDEFQKIFGRKRVRTFGMMKYLKDHLFTEEEYEERFVGP